MLGRYIMNWLRLLDEALNVLTGGDADSDVLPSSAMADV